MYWRDKWDFTESIEYEYKFAGNYGAKGEKRQKKKKATREQVRKQNQLNREKKMRRLIKANFGRGDIWACLKYPKGTRKPVEEVEKDLSRFIRNMRRAYKRRKEAFRYVYRMEIGKQGGIHIHILVNRISVQPGTDMLIQKYWQQGRASYENIYSSGGYRALAEYIVKQPDSETMEQMALFDLKDRKKLIKYSSSRNLIRPEPERSRHRRRTLRKLIGMILRGDGPEPSPGYYIDRSSVYMGVNPFTGYSYLQYTEHRIESQRKEEPPWIW